MVAVAIVLAWQSLTVHANDAGNWTGLFRTGRLAPVPELLRSTTFRSLHPSGYDGQYYRLLAHDPFLRHGVAAYLDDPVWRARRILVPLTVWLLAGGRQNSIDAAYVLVIAGSIFLGVNWLGGLLRQRQMHSAAGLLFVAVPATIVAIDSMTVDVALAALTVCVVCQLATGRERGLWLALAAAGLVRETGLLLAGACVLAPLFRRDFRKAFWRATAILPTLAWFAYLQAVLATPPQAVVPNWVIPGPQLGILLRALHPIHYPLLTAPVERLVRVLDSVSLTATMAVAAMAALRIRAARPREVGIAIGLYIALLLAMTTPGFWDVPYSYCRPFAPLFVLLLVEAAGLRRRWLVAASLSCALVDVRLVAEMKTQLSGVLHWLGA